jgi:riboflavin kinase/FMN adenylyltransferase
VRIFRHLRDIPAGTYQAAAFGAFDGLHLGHRQLLAQLLERGDRASLVLLDERTVPPLRLSSRRRCLDGFRASGVAAVLIVRGRDAELGTMVASLGLGVLLAGAGECVPTALRAVRGLCEVPPVAVDGEPITGKRLRAALIAGDLDAAARMLGAPFAVAGRVVHGFHRGATIGVPTANLRVRGWQLPPDGVYAVSVATGTFAGTGVANLGSNPTFGGSERSLETHVFDFAGDLYGARLEVGFAARLRGERKFANVDDLVTQIHRDIAAARRIHARHG